LDVLVGGPVAQQSAQSFEAYWTSKYAIPIAQLGKFTPDPARFDAARTELRARCDGLRDSDYGRALADSDLAETCGQCAAPALGRRPRDRGPPDKISQPAGTPSAGFLSGQLSPYARGAQKDMLIVSPYFVPGKDGVAFFGERRRRA